MARPRKTPTETDLQNRGIHTVYINNLLWEMAVNFTVTHGFSMSDLIEGLLKSTFKYQDKYDLLQSQCKESALDFINNIQLASQESRNKSIKEAKDVQKLTDELIESKKEEQKQQEIEEQKYKDKVWRAMRREIIFDYEVIRVQLKEIESKRARGDEEDYEAESYQTIRAILFDKKILHSQKDLSFPTFVACFNSIDYDEEVLKPRLEAEKEMEEEE